MSELSSKIEYVKKCRVICEMEPSVFKIQNSEGKYGLLQICNDEEECTADELNLHIIECIYDEMGSYNDCMIPVKKDIAISVLLV